MSDTVAAAQITGAATVAGVLVGMVGPAVIEHFRQRTEKRARAESRAQVLADQQREALQQLVEAAVTWAGAAAELVFVKPGNARELELAAAERVARLQFMKLPPRIRSELVRKVAEQVIGRGADAVVPADRDPLHPSYLRYQEAVQQLLQVAEQELRPYL